MKTILKPAILSILILTTGCTERSKEAEKTKEEAAAKARAEAAKKEMDTLPTVFSTPDYFKKNPAAKSGPAEQTKTEPTKK